MTATSGHVFTAALISAIVSSVCTYDIAYHSGKREGRRVEALALVQPTHLASAVYQHPAPRKTKVERAIEDEVERRLQAEQDNREYLEDQGEENDDVKTR